MKKCCFSPLSLNKVKNKKGSPNSKCQKALCFFCKTEFLLSDSPNLLTGRRKAGRPYDGSGKKKKEEKKEKKENQKEERQTASYTGCSSIPKNDAAATSGAWALGT